MKKPTYREQLQECKMLIDKYKLELKQIVDNPHKEAKDYKRMKFLNDEIDEEDGSLQIKKRRLLNLIN